MEGGGAGGQDAVPAPADRAVLAREQVGGGGAVVSSEPVRVSVPVGAVDDAVVEVREALGEFGSFVGGAVVGVEHEGPVRKPITVAWDVSHLDEFQQQALFLVRWDEEVDDWVPVDDDTAVRIEGGTLTAEIDQWSFWSWLTSLGCKVVFGIVFGGAFCDFAKNKLSEWEGDIGKFVAQVNDWAADIGDTITNVVQWGGELIGARARAPHCSGAALPSSVSWATDPVSLGNAAAVRVCYEPLPDGESVRVKMANNRLYGQVITFTGGGIRLGDRPTIGFDLSPSEVVRALASAWLSSQKNKKVYIPPLRTVVVDLPRPLAKPTLTSTRFSNNMSDLEFAQASLVDLAVFVLETLEFDNLFLQVVGEMLSQCGLQQAWRLVESFSSGGFKELPAALLGIAKDCLEVLGDPKSAYGKQLEIQLADKMGSKNRAIHTIKKTAKSLKNAANVLKIAGLLLYAGDLVLHLLAGPAEFQITWKNKPAPEPTPKPTPEPQTPAATGTHNTAIAAGIWNSCAIKADRTLTCWGFDDDGIDAPAGQFTAIAAASGHACAIRTDRTIACWGFNSSGLADAPAGQFTAIDADLNHYCAIRTDQTIACWGWNEHGQTDAPAGQYTAVAAGGNHSCAIRADQTIACWGLTEGVYNVESVSLEPPAGRYTAIAAGTGFSCAIRADQTIACWGDNYLGQTNAPSGQFTAIAAGEAHACAIRTARTLACWGFSENYSGMKTGQADPPSGQFTAVAANWHRSCAIRADQTIACWGDDSYGDLPDPPPGRFGPPYS